MPRLLDEITARQNGAHFVRADLHVHSFGASKDVKDSRMTVEKIIDEAVRKNIGILSITDHHSASNLTKAVEHAQQYAARLLFVPGVEISTSHGHLLAYFRDARRVDELLVLLKIRDSSSAPEGHVSASLADTITQVHQLGGISVAAHIDRKKTGFETLPGYQSWKRDILTHSGLYGLEFDEDSHLAWYTLDDDDGVGAAERKKLFLARRDLGIRLQLAHIQSSDAHDLDKFIATETLTRIKLDELTFSSFLLAFKDPEGRVRPVAQLPTHYPRIIGATIDGGFLDGLDFHFSSNLNCFFGGRGAGKSTAVRAVAHALGAETTIADRPDCPKTITVYAQDGNGAVWCFQKERASLGVGYSMGDQPNFQSPDSFPIEYYGQNDLARVSESLTTDGMLLQEFLDTHLSLGDISAREGQLRAAVRDVAASLVPLEVTFSKLPGLQAQVRDFDRRLKAAEDGKLKDVASAQASLGNERNLLQSLRTVIAAVGKKLALAALRIDFKGLEASAGSLLTFKPSPDVRKTLSTSFQKYNAVVEAATESIAIAHADLSRDLDKAALDLAASHSKLESRINAKTVELQKQGLKGSIKDLQLHIRMRSQSADQVIAIERRTEELTDLRTRRVDLLAALFAVRSEWDDRRRKQLEPVNRSLARTISDFKVVFLYDKAGQLKTYFAFIARAMNGTHFMDEQIQRLCSGTTPQSLASIIRFAGVSRLKELILTLQIDQKWSTALLKRLGSLEILLELEEIWKPALPCIKILTRTMPSRDVPVAHLSDGQRHTVLLTVAMLSDSFLPLIIDQPEDDLDNAFIFTTVVAVLREVKEKRQVIVVTHNANIAVLGDSEMLFPMKRQGDVGTVFDEGSIDREVTREAVQKILEGGRAAFQRRAEMYHFA
jgi:energy-coupling factor transporter ATP-binding protein EcfA2